MIRYKDLPDLIPPAVATVDAIEVMEEWLKDPLAVAEPAAEATETVVGIREKSDELIKEFEDAYKKKLEGTSEDDSTEEAYFKRLRQINDTANLFAAVSIATLTRENLLGVGEK